MTIPTIFETSRPRDDVLRGAIAEADFAADLAQVVAGRGGAEYLDPARFLRPDLSDPWAQGSARQRGAAPHRRGR